MTEDKVRSIVWECLKEWEINFLRPMKPHKTISHDEDRQKVTVDLLTSLIQTVEANSQ